MSISQSRGFNALAGLAGGDVLVVWEDDDIYLPWHITAHVEALSDGGFSKPSRVLSLYTGELHEEEAVGRFHASIAFTREVFELAGGWPLTKRGDFDQTFLQRLAGVATLVDPCRAFAPSYVFRWGSTRCYHGQGLMRGPNDVEWYERVSDAGSSVAMNAIEPELDAETARVLGLPLHRGFAIVG